MRGKITLLMAVAVLGLSGAADAQTRLTITDGREAASLEAGGWVVVSEGLWQRSTLDGRKETFVSGAAGLQSVLPVLREQQRDLQEAFAADPSAANKRALDGQTQLIEAVEANLVSAVVSGKAGADTTACTRTFSYGADAFYLGHCVDESTATASYSTSNPTACPQLCTVQTYAYASRKCGSEPAVVDSDSCALTGTNVSCASSAFAFIGSQCYLYASASIHCPQLNNLYLSQTDYATACTCTC
jgi:hypothetical protein